MSKHSAAKSRRNGNMGHTGLRRRRRKTDPMRDYDALPPVLRRWMQQAALPWSATSCRRIWNDTLSSGGSPHEAVLRLQRAEAATLSRVRAP